jgi:hypothetical protein
VGLEPTIPVFERAETVHALDRTAIVIGGSAAYIMLIQEWANNFHSCVPESIMKEFLQFDMSIFFAFIEYIKAFGKNAK